MSRLFLGTAEENMADMARKGHARRTALSDTQVAEIRMRVLGGETLAAVAASMAISASHVHRLVHQELRTQVADGSAVKQPYVRLSCDQVAEIRGLAAAGKRNVDIAEAFGIDPARVSRIVHRKERV